MLTQVATIRKPVKAESKNKESDFQLKTGSIGGMICATIVNMFIGVQKPNLFLDISLDLRQILDLTGLQRFHHRGFARCDDFDATFFPANPSIGESPAWFKSSSFDALRNISRLIAYQLA